jgi:hypothetical protein
MTMKSPAANIRHTEAIGRPVLSGEHSRRQIPGSRTAPDRPIGAESFDAIFGVLLEVAVEDGVIESVVHLSGV